MLYYLTKLTVSAVIIVAITELAKRHSGLAALVASLPLTSLLAFVWLHLESHPIPEIASLSVQIFWLVLPSLVFFVVLPALLRMGHGFWLSLAAAAAATSLAYLALLPLLRRWAVI
jgi:hypothetical protein